MKNKLIILIFVVLVLAIFIWLMKPSDQVSTVSSVVEPQNSSTSSESSQHVAQQQSTTEIESQNDDPSVANSNGEAELFDTKSDLSIQPVDPETDPGNQVIEPKE